MERLLVVAVREFSTVAEAQLEPGGRDLWRIVGPGDGEIGISRELGIEGDPIDHLPAHGPEHNGVHHTW